MAKGAYGGVSSKARKVKGYVGVSNIARKLKKAYIGDSNGKARLCWSGYDYNNVLMIVFSGASFDGNLRQGNIDNCMSGSSYTQIPAPPSPFSGNGSWYTFFWLNGFYWCIYVEYQSSTNRALISLAKIPEKNGSAWTVVKNREIILNSIYNPLGSVYFGVQAWYNRGTDTVHAYFMYGVLQGNYTTCDVEIYGDGNYTVRSYDYSGWGQVSNGKMFIDDDNRRYFVLNVTNASTYLASSTPALGSPTIIQSYGYEYAQPRINVAFPNSFGARFTSTGQSSGYGGSKDVFKYTTMKGTTWYSSNTYDPILFMFKDNLYYEYNTSLFKGLPQNYPNQFSNKGYYGILAITETAMYLQGKYGSGGYNGTLYKSIDGETYTAIATGMGSKTIRVIESAPNGYFYW